MNFDELSGILLEAGVNVCPICGTPYDKRYKQQKTCGTDECKRLYKNKYLRERRQRLIAEDKEAYNAKHAKANRKYRKRKRDAKVADRNYQRLQEHWESVAGIKGESAEDGFFYGKRQMEKTLAMIPKIDVNLERGNKDDNVHGQDDAE